MLLIPDLPVIRVCCLVHHGAGSVQPLREHMTTRFASGLTLEARRTAMEARRSAIADQTQLHAVIGESFNAPDTGVTGFQTVHVGIVCTDVVNPPEVVSQHMAWFGQHGRHSGAPRARVLGLFRLLDRALVLDRALGCHLQRRFPAPSPVFSQRSLGPSRCA